MSLKNNRKQILIIFVFVVFICFFIIFSPKIFGSHYVLKKEVAGNILQEDNKKTLEKIPSYINTPDTVKGIYMTSWTAGTPSLRNTLVDLVDKTEINSIVIDIKDYSGRIAFETSDPNIKKIGSEEIRIKDLQKFIEDLHNKNIYVIGRIAVFQDAYFVKLRPDLAVKNKSGSAVWKDHKGISWIDPGSKEYWDYIISIAKEARKIGFDEINFDYIRFPSDGDMKDISYPWSSTTPKTKILRNFFSYVKNSLIDDQSKQDRVKISADLFGMVTTASDDMGIGQYLEDVLPYFDYIMPMVYPSHYPPTFNGFKNPEAYPYEVVKFAMQSGVKRREVLASSTKERLAELRPWLQDFGLKMNYGPNEVRAQIKATNDSGLNSWILWSASNKYTKGALSEDF